MSVHDDDLLPELRRSTDPVDRRLARLLGRLAFGTPAVPRASDRLAAFLAEASAGAPLEPSTDNDTVPVAAAVDDFVVRLGRRAPRSSPMRPRLLTLKKVLKTGLLAKVMLGTTVALTGVGAAAATGNLPGTGGDDNVVVVTPADDDGGSNTPSDDPLGVIDLDDEGEDDADEPDDDADDDADEDADDADDQGEDADDQGEDADDQGEDADDQGEDADDQGEDADDDGDNSGPGSDDQGDDEQGDDEQGDDESSDDESHDDGGEDDESGDDGSGEGDD